MSVGLSAISTQTCNSFWLGIEYSGEYMWDHFGFNIGSNNVSVMFIAQHIMSAGLNAICTQNLQ